jgi:TonB-linked SusC/RagA family outer membrane protein
MRNILLKIALCFVALPAFAQVPVTANDSIINDSISSMDKVLEEVVVIGYGTKRAGAITGSVAQIKSADIVRTPAQSAIQAIQGKAAGINIVTNDEPGGSPSIRIRGLGTVLGARDPLYVIDGIEISRSDGGNPLAGINPTDIATIDILKDASSLAIYGQKGANGVVIITTKKGKAGEFKVTYDAYYGQKFIQQKVDMADSYLYAYYNNTALGSSSYFNFNQPYSTDWLEEITGTGEVMSNSVAISGGSENTSVYFGVTNYQEKGILNGTAFERTSLLNKNEYRLFNQKLKITQFVNLAIENNTPKPLSAFTNAYKQSPIIPVRFPNGRYGAPIINEAGFADPFGEDRFNNVGNPVAQLDLANAESRAVVLLGSVGAEYKITDSFKFNSSFGANAIWAKSYNYFSNFNQYLATNPALGEADFIAQGSDTQTLRYNTLTQAKTESYQWNWDNYLTYTKSFGESELTVVAGMSRTTRDISSGISGTRTNVPEDTNYWSLNFSDNFDDQNPSTIVSGSSTTPVVSLAYFGRVEYEFKNKYLLTASVRREGISSFLEEKRFDIFPAISAGWIVSDEEFMSNSFVDFLKIRGGYGEVGNGYRGSGVNRSLNDVLFVSAQYPFGNTVNPGLNNPSKPDPNLSWETIEEIGFGIDFRTLTNRLSGTVDLYNRKSKDLVLPVQLPDVISPGEIFLNTGEVVNKGVELTLKWQDAIGDNFNYWIGGNFSYNQNELTKVDSPFFANFVGGNLGNGVDTKQVLVGQPLGTFYVYEATGFDSDGALALSPNRVAAGSYLPKYTYGANIGATWKSLDFSVDIYGVGGNKIYNGKKAQRFGGENIEAAVLDNFWIPSNPNAVNPRPSNEIPRPSTYFIEDGSFLRINNITIGYTLPKIIDGLDRLRIYFTAVNPFIFTEYSGYSPELVGGDNANPLGNAGIELDAYPTNKTFLFGVNVGL